MEAASTSAWKKRRHVSVSQSPDGSFPCKHTLDDVILRMKLNTHDEILVKIFDAFHHGNTVMHRPDHKINIIFSLEVLPI